MANDMITMLKDWVSNHPKGSLSLLPQNLGRGILDALTAESAEMLARNIKLNQRPEATPYVTTACLMLLAGSQPELTIHEASLSQAIGAYVRALHLESMHRKGVIKNLRPEFSQDNIFDPQVHFHFELTELGRTLEKQISPSQLQAEP